MLDEAFLRTLPLKDLPLEISDHAWNRFRKRFPAPCLPKDQRKVFFDLIRNSTFLTFGNEDKLIYGYRYWEFILSVKEFDSGRIRISVVSCWVNCRATRVKRKYNRSKERFAWKLEVDDDAARVRAVFILTRPGLESRNHQAWRD